jgi:NAD(P)-dependent dehydrogenase (short-subunit alcohol dehydrogenase family)
MKVVIVGANGKVGQYAKQALAQKGCEIVEVGRKSAKFSANIEDRDSLRSLFQKITPFDAVVNAAGEVAFAPFPDLTPNQWQSSFRSKLMGQIDLVHEALPFLSPNGSLTLISGILGEEQIRGGTVAATVNGAIEAFVKSAALELPKGIRINVVSPTLLSNSAEIYGAFFPGFVPVSGEAVAQAVLRSVMGHQTGRVFKVWQ